MDEHSLENEQHTINRYIYYSLGVIEVLFAFRLVFKLLGANPASIFVYFIYTVSQTFMAPFAGIFRPSVTSGIETQSVLEPATIIAMIVYALMAWGIAKIIDIYLDRQKLR